MFKGMFAISSGDNKLKFVLCFGVYQGTGKILQIL